MIPASKRILVTGATGFLGSRVVELARRAGWAVRTLERTPRASIDNREVFIGDISNRALLRQACEGVFAVVHAAGRAHQFGRNANDAAAFNAVNDTGVANLVDAAVECGVPHVVLASSVSVYGNYPGSACTETVPCSPRGAYAVSKWQGELRAMERMATASASLAILRFATIYGEGDRGNVAKLITAIGRRRFIWPGPGRNQKSLIYVEDAARACLCPLERAAPGIEIYNVSGPPATMRQIVAAISHALGRPVPRLGIPFALLNAAGAVSHRIGDPGHLNLRLQKFIHDDVYDGTKFDRAFNFSITVPLAEGLRRQVEAMRAGVPA